MLSNCQLDDFARTQEFHNLAIVYKHVIRFCLYTKYVTMYKSTFRCVKIVTNQTQTMMFRTLRNLMIPASSIHSFSIKRYIQNGNISSAPACSVNLNQ